MRLGQLARKLSQRPSEIVDYLASQSIKIEEGANTRLEDDQVDLIMRKFAPEMLDAVAVADVEKSSEVNTPVTVETTVDETPAAVEEIKVEEIKTETEPLPAIPPDLIKAPKVSLSGLKVLGKIDLPEPKAKEPAPESSDEPKPETPAPPQQHSERKVTERRPRREQQRTYKNPVALKREHEEKAEQQRREALAAQAKEKKTQNYLRKVKMSPPTKAVRLINEEFESMSAEELAPGPTSWFGKFIKWLRT